MLEAVKQFPCRVQLQEVPRVSLWPSQFQETNPNEFNIALFFFAKDIERFTIRLCCFYFTTAVPLTVHAFIAWYLISFVNSDAVMKTLIRSCWQMC